jgi:hypothetical protein
LAVGGGIGLPVRLVSTVEDDFIGVGGEFLLVFLGDDACAFMAVVGTFVYDWAAATVFDNVGTMYPMDCTQLLSFCWFFECGWHGQFVVIH